MTKQANYRSGNDYVVEFLHYRFSFGSSDFEERVVAAAVRLELVAGNDLAPEETADIFEMIPAASVRNASGVSRSYSVGSV